MRILVIIIFFNLYTNSIYAQMINCNWLDYSKGSDSYCMSIDHDGNNNVFATGYYKKLILGDYNTTTSGIFNTYVVSYDTDGNIAWLNNFGSYDCRGEFIKCDGENNVIVLGRFQGTVDFSDQQFNSSGSDNLFLVKYDNTGQIIWAKHIKNDAELSPKSLETDSLGNLYIMVAVTSDGKTDITTHFGNIDKKGSLLIAKYDPDGQAIWVKEAVGSEGYISSKPLSISQSGEVYYTGTFRDTISFANTTIISKGFWKQIEDEEVIGDSIYYSTNDFFIAKLNKEGSEEWIKVTGNYRDEYGLYSATNNNKIYVAGTFSDSLTFSTNSPLRDGGDFLIAYDTSGRLLNYRQLGICEMQKITSNNTNVFMIGGNGDILIDKYDLDLNLFQTAQVGGDNIDVGFGITVDDNSSILIGANFSSKNLEVGKYSITNQCFGYNFFIAKLSSNLTSIDANITGNQLLIFPNPANDIIKGKTNFLNREINIKIMNTLGNQLINKQIITDNSGFFETSLSSLNSGVYFIQINNKNEYINNMIIKD